MNVKKLVSISDEKFYLFLVFVSSHGELKNRNLSGKCKVMGFGCQPW